MTQLTFQDRQIWQDLSSILENIDNDALVREHLDACEYKVCGYWDEDDTYYAEIILPRNLQSELISSSIGFTGKERFLQFKFILSASTEPIDRSIYQSQKVGEIVLIYNENLEFLDERWTLDIDSPLLELKK